MAKDKSYAVFDEMESWAEEMHAEKKNGVFDDANESWNAAPELVRELADAANVDAQNGRYLSGRNLVSAALDSAMSAYEVQHGVKPSGAVVHNAVRTALNSVSREALKRAGVGATFDEVSATQSGAPMVSNRAALALYQGLVEAIPFAGYIPMSEGLAGRIIVAQNRAGSATGGYNKGQPLDGFYGGKTFMSHERTVEMQSSDQTTFTAKIAYADGDANGSPIIASGTQILVNGLPAGGASLEAVSSEQNTPLSGSIVLNDGTEYSFSGKATNEQGEISIRFASALPSGIKVYAVGLLNYQHEKLSQKRPVFSVDAQPYSLRATESSGVYQVTPEARMQWDAEVRVDIRSQIMLAMRQQHSAEKHMAALRAMYRIGKNFIHTADMQTSSRLDARNRADVWRDALLHLTVADNDMLTRTNAFGIGVIYVGNKGKAELSSLPPEIFQSANIPARPGIYRIGRLFGQYEVYYAPNLVAETANSLEMLCIGRSEQTGLNPYIMGDVVAPTFTKLGVGVDLKEGEGYFHAGAARINPYAAAAQGAAIVAITGL